MILVHGLIWKFMFQLWFWFTDVDCCHFCILQCILFLGKQLVVRWRQKVYRLVQNRLLSIPCSLSGALSAIGSCSPCIILDLHSFYVYTPFIHAILQYQCIQRSTSWPPKWSIAQHSAFNHHSLIINIAISQDFILQKNLQNV